MTSAKDLNLAYFQKELPNLLANPLMNGKFVVIHGEKLQQAFDSFPLALRFAVALYPPTEFVIQQVIDDRDVINFLRAAV